jgi:hypothetical protein
VKVWESREVISAKPKDEHMNQLISFASAYPGLSCVIAFSLLVSIAYVLEKIMRYIALNYGFDVVILLIFIMLAAALLISDFVIK